MSKKVCKECVIEKVHEYAYLGKNGSAVYKDEKGRLWKSGVCCDCQAKQRKAARAYQKTQKEIVPSGE